VIVNLVATGPSPKMRAITLECILNAFGGGSEPAVMIIE
jgi:hypothetical protein